MSDVITRHVITKLANEAIDKATEIARLKADNAKLRELLLDCWDFSHLMHEAMAARFYELGLIDDGEARELGVEVDG